MKRAFAPAKVILFGSRARGDWLHESDWDIAVISPKFEGMNMYDRSVAVHRLQREAISIEVLCYTPEEFERLSKMLTIEAEIKKEGKELLATAKP